MGILDEEAIDGKIDEVKEEFDGKLEDKQDTLTAGENITIEDNVISAAGGGAGSWNDLTDRPFYTESFEPIEYTEEEIEQLPKMELDPDTYIYQYATEPLTDIEKLDLTKLYYWKDGEKVPFATEAEFKSGEAYIDDPESMDGLDMYYCHNDAYYSFSFAILNAKEDTDVEGFIISKGFWVSEISLIEKETEEE